MSLPARIVARLPAPVRTRLRAARARRRGAAPPVGSVRLGDLARTTPISEHWGFDRGTPIDRVFIEAFLERHRGDIRGRVLEVADDGYTRWFGSDLTRVDVLSVTATPVATIVADLADAPGIADGSFDCAIVTQTLQYVWDLRGAVATVHRILAPGGVVLVSVPGLIRLDEPSWQDLWRFTPASARRLFAEVFGEERVEVESSGNVVAGAAFLYGLAAEELDPDLLGAQDPRMPVSILVRATKLP